MSLRCAIAFVVIAQHPPVTFFQHIFRIQEPGPILYGLGFKLYVITRCLLEASSILYGPDFESRVITLSGSLMSLENSGVARSLRTLYTIDVERRQKTMFTTKDLQHRLLKSLNEDTPHARNSVARIGTVMIAAKQLEIDERGNGTTEPVVLMEDDAS